MGRRFSNRQRVILFFTLFAMVVLTLSLSNPVHSYVQAVKSRALETGGSSLNHGKDPLLQEILALSQSINEKPVNARIDRVWQAIPGYNGLEVDVAKSYAIAKEMGRVDLRQLVIDEVEPEVTLDDLPPAAIYRGNPKKPAAALMINVAWGTEYVMPILDVLDDYQVKATFFLDGKWLERHQPLAKELIKRNHEIGNHAYSHPDMRQLSIEDIYAEMNKTEELIGELGKKSYFFAPPAGAYDDRVVKVARQLNMHTVMWTLDTLDWRKPAPEEITARIVPHIENGVLILMHPTEPTLKALPSIIEGALNKGIELGTLSEVLSSDRIIFIEPVN